MQDETAGADRRQANDNCVSQVNLCLFAPAQSHVTGKSGSKEALVSVQSSRVLAYSGKPAIYYLCCQTTLKVPPLPASPDG